MNLYKNIESHVNTLAQFTSTPREGVTRVVYTEEDVKAKDYIKDEMNKLSLNVKEDEVGNIFAVWKGTDSSLPQVWTGSHMDAPTNGGKYDGVVGVFGALEAIRILKDEGFQPLQDIVMVVFSSEEPTRFGVGCIGSRALTGIIEEEHLDEWKDDEGKTFREVLKSRGKDPKRVLQEQLQPSTVKSFIEFHIEQGQVLEVEGKSIGIVNTIAAPSEINLVVFGEQRHAGSTPMALRKDPVPAASEVVLLVERVARKASATSVGTVGKMKVFPGASNVIAEKVEITIDIRDIHKNIKDKMITQLEQEVATIMDKRNLLYHWQIKSDDLPSEMDKGNIALIEESVTELGYSYKIMPSGAYHDAMIMSKMVPCNMIFVPSEKGISHAPEEYTSTSEIAKGIEVLAKTLRKLSE